MAAISRCTVADGSTGCFVTQLWKSALCLTRDPSHPRRNESQLATQRLPRACNVGPATRFQGLIGTLAAGARQAREVALAEESLAAFAALQNGVGNYRADHSDDHADHDLGHPALHAFPRA